MKAQKAKMNEKQKPEVKKPMPKPESIFTVTWGKH